MICTVTFKALEENTTEYGISFNVNTMSLFVVVQLMYLQVVRSQHQVYMVMNMEK